MSDNHIMQPSLKELATSKSLDEILNSDFRDSDFEALEPRLQRILFGKLRAEVIRLQEVEQSWSFYIKDCPHADRQLYTCAARERLGDGEEDEKLQFQEKWSYAEDTEEDERLDITSWWSAWDLRVEDLTSNRSRLVLRNRKSKTSSDAFRLLQSEDSARFTDSISSQLLYYRLTAVFGMMPHSVSDEYKCCWTTDLFCEGGKGRLCLNEHKGAAEVHFYGTEDGSIEALQLLNFLVGNKVPHSYDGILAGTVA